MGSTHTMETSIEWEGRKDESNFEMTNKQDMPGDLFEMARGTPFSTFKG